MELGVVRESGESFDGGHQVWLDIRRCLAKTIEPPYQRIRCWFYNVLQHTETAVQRESVSSTKKEKKSIYFFLNLNIYLNNKIEKNRRASRARDREQNIQKNERPEKRVRRDRSVDSSTSVEHVTFTCFFFHSIQHTNLFYFSSTS